MILYYTEYLLKCPLNIINRSSIEVEIPLNSSLLHYKPWLIFQTMILSIQYKKAYSSILQGNLMSLASLYEL